MFPVRLRNVAGLEGRFNDLLFHPAACKQEIVPLYGTLVFFCGDVQDYSEVMLAHRDNRHYVKWNLDNSARMLSRMFPTKHVLVVRPSRIQFKSISCYDNFVQSSDTGVPEHAPNHNALHHLQKLLQSVSSRLMAITPSDLTTSSAPDVTKDHINLNETKQACSAHIEELETVEDESDPLWWRSDLALDRSPLILVGFSKGCVVLNQLVHEFHYMKTSTTTDDLVMGLVSRIEEMCWLDGGHAGAKDTWLIDPTLLATLSALDININVHVSPYQVLDDNRPWIGKEEKIFTGTLKKRGAKIARYQHGSSEDQRTVLMHFDVLSNFKKMQDTPAAFTENQ